jgi:site-specific DNA recombinase
MDEVKTKPVKVYSYIRVSTSMQVDKYSVDAQRNSIQKHIDYKDMVLVHEYKDLGISGKNIEDRTEFKQMLKDIANKKDDVKFVLVYKLSRFGRNAADVLSSLEHMRDYGVNLICVADEINSSVDSGKLMISIMAAMAEIERENIRAFTMVGRKQKASTGGWNGGFLAYGYTMKDDEIHVVEDEAKIVREIYNMYVNECIGATGIAKRLNATGVVKKIRHKGELSTFSAPFIRKVLDNPIYKGYISYGRRKSEKIDGKRAKYHVVKEKDPDNIIEVKGKHEAIITEELWQQAQQRKRDMSGKKEKLEKEHEYILSGLISCPYCGKHMYGIPDKNIKKDGSSFSVSYAYACRQNNKATGHSCPRPRQYNCKDIDDQVAKLVIWQLNRTEVLEEMAKQAYKEFDVSELSNRISDSKSKIESYEEKKKGYERKIRELNPSSPTYDTMLDFYAESMEEVVSDIVVLKNIIKEDEEKIKNSKEREAQWNSSLNFLLRLLSNYDDYSDYEKKKLMQKLVKNIEIYPEKKAYGYLKSIEFTFPIFKSNLTDETDTIYTIQDAYPGLVDENGEFTDYDPDEDYEIPEPALDENGCVPASPDPIDYYEEHGCWPSEDLMNESSKLALQYWEEHKAERYERAKENAMKIIEKDKENNPPPKDNHVETVCLLSRK